MLRTGAPEVFATDHQDLFVAASPVDEGHRVSDGDDRDLRILQDQLRQGQSSA